MKSNVIPLGDYLNEDINDWVCGHRTAYLETGREKCRNCPYCCGATNLCPLYDPPVMPERFKTNRRNNHAEKT